MAMKKRYVKRTVRKIIIFTITISLMATMITTIIMEKQITKQGQFESNNEEKSAVPLDTNDDQATPSFLVANDVSVLPRPPVRQRLIQERDETVDADMELIKLPVATGLLRDWFDYKAMEKDKHRIGMGEHGEPSFIKNESLKKREHLLSGQNGYNALLSNYISVNRSLPDVRPQSCKTKPYLAKLPTVSVVVTFFNEYFSVLHRTLHSIKNRSPPELLKQIILVDDFSDRAYSHKQLENYVADKFPGLVSVVRLSKRTGLMGARMVGAKRATGQILLFLDSHIEVNVNWLPPLIEPIALSPKIVTCPIVDSIDHESFEYTKSKVDGYRGVFDWEMNYKQLPLLPEDAVDKTKPSKNPIMMGRVFAIGQEFFWALGGYDIALDISGAEKFELSFKIWMCAGMIFDVPCSRVAHIFRGPIDEMLEPRKYNDVGRTNKRVAEVWMDEYKHYLYERNPDFYKEIDAGDLAIQKATRERLKCKPFKWFLQVVAPDALKAFPPVEPRDYAAGRVQSVAYDNLCLDGRDNGYDSPVGLFECNENNTVSQLNQHWSLTRHHDMRLLRTYNCLDVYDEEENSTIWFENCHNEGGNQFWYYDRKQQWLVHGWKRGMCMEAIVDEDKYSVVVSTCDATIKSMKWRFDFVNDTALDNFFEDLLTKSWILGALLTS